MKKILAILCVLALTLALAACGGSTTTTPDPGQKTNTTETPAPATEAPAADSVVGVYKMTNLVSNDPEDAETDLMAMLEAFGVTYYMTIEEGGFGFMDIMGDKTPVTWTDAELTLVDEESGEDQSVPYTYENGVLTIAPEEGTMTFEKLTGEELEDYLVNGSTVPSWMEGDDEIPEGESSTGPVSGAINGCEVTILGAEAAEDDDGAPMLRVYYEFTNGTDEITSSFSALYFNAAQDGEKLESAYVYDNAVPEDANEDIDLLPGVTIRAAYRVSYDPEGGTVGIRFSDLFDDDVLLYYIDPSDPIDAPEEPFVFEQNAELFPDIFEDTELENDMISIQSYEYTADWEGAPLVRVYYDYTNTGDETDSCFMDTTVYAFQDGYSLESGYADDDVDEDSNRYENVEPGESVSCSEVFEIRSDSPIFFVVKIDATDELLVAVIDDVETGITGFYQLYSIMGYSIEEYAQLAEVTVTEAAQMLSVLIRADGTATWSNDGDEYELEWYVDGDEITLYSEEDDETLVGTVEGSFLTFEIEEIEVVLVKAVG